MLGFNELLLIRLVAMGLDLLQLLYSQRQQCNNYKNLWLVKSPHAYSEYYQVHVINEFSDHNSAHLLETATHC